jgi:hypothetical protein
MQPLAICMACMNDGSGGHEGKFRIPVSCFEKIEAGTARSRIRRRRATRAQGNASRGKDRAACEFNGQGPRPPRRLAVTPREQASGEEGNGLRQDCREHPRTGLIASRCCAFAPELVTL